jgi:hypothetical protein
MNLSNFAEVENLYFEAVVVFLCMMSVGIHNQVLLYIFTGILK